MNDVTVLLGRKACPEKDRLTLWMFTEREGEEGRGDLLWKVVFNGQLWTIGFHCFATKVPVSRG